MSLVTLEVAKNHLRIEAAYTDEDGNIARKVAQASSILLNYLKVATDNWQDSSGEPVDVPPLIEAAVLLILGALYENVDGSTDAPQPLSQAAKDLVHRYRDPALA